MRKQLFLLSLLLFVASLNLCTAKGFAREKTKDNYFPIARLVTTPVFITEDASLSFLSEGGPRSYRINGTIGFIPDCQNRFKFSGEYLSEKLHFGFEDGRSHRWVHQYALGGKYLYTFDCPCFFEGLELGLDYSHAINKSLSDDFFDQRNIAGSWSWTTQAGLWVQPWDCANFLLAITYDQVAYNRKVVGRKRVSGVGMTLDYNQRILNNFLVDVYFQFKQAYNHLGGSLRWLKRFHCGDADLGVFAYHVFGKRRLPSSTTAGIELGFAFGICDCTLAPIGSCGYSDCGFNTCSYEVSDLVLWGSVPAVYKPQVLSISDEEHHCR